MRTTAEGRKQLSQMASTQLCALKASSGDLAATYGYHYERILNLLADFADLEARLAEADDLLKWIWREYPDENIWTPRLKKYLEERDLLAPDLGLDGKSVTERTK